MGTKLWLICLILPFCVISVLLCCDRKVRRQTYRDARTALDSTASVIAAGGLGLLVRFDPQAAVGILFLVIVTWGIFDALRSAWRTALEMVLPTEPQPR